MGMAMKIRPLSDAIGAEITGIDVNAGLSGDEFGALAGAYHAHCMVAIRDQSLEPAAQVAFARRFGDIQYHISPEYCLADFPEIMVLSNEMRDGKPVGIPDAGSDWHSDHSYMPTPTGDTMLHALRVADEGGDTEWANMYTAYDTLPEALKARIEGLIGIHSFNRLKNPRVKVGKRHGNAEEYYKRSPPDVYHPIARTHPATGRKALYITPRFTIGIRGMEDDEAQPLLDELFAHQMNRDFVYRHTWRKGDLVIWDNRCTIHKALGGIKPPGIRHLHRATVLGEMPA
jgi:taurine dioxygenase